MGPTIFQQNTGMLNACSKHTLSWHYGKLCKGSGQHGCINPGCKLEGWNWQNPNFEHQNDNWPNPRGCRMNFYAFIILSQSLF